MHRLTEILHPSQLSFIIEKQPDSKGVDHALLFAMLCHLLTYVPKALLNLFCEKQ